MRPLPPSQRTRLAALALLALACSPASAPDREAAPVRPVTGWSEASFDPYATRLRPPSDSAFSAISDEVVETDEGTLRKIVSYSQVYEIDRIYRSMEGPSSVLQISLAPAATAGELIWLKGVYAEVVDAAGENTESQQFMCHVVGGIRTLDERDARFGFHSNDDRFATLSQGEYQKEYPRGFGVPVLPSDVLQYSSQVLNHNLPEVERRVRHKIVTLFIRDSERKLPIQALSNTFAQSMVVVSPDANHGYFGVRMPDTEVHGESCSIGENADPFHRVFEDPYGREFSGHWVVLPGRASNQTLATYNMSIPYDTRIHTIDVHLHPFAESVELRDLTTQETVFRSQATQLEGGVGLTHVETYSSEEGIPVYADHEYAIISTYENTTSSNQDAMASLYFGYANKEFDPEVVGDPVSLEQRKRQRLESLLPKSREAVRLDPTDPIAHFRLGTNLFHLERFAEAVPVLEEAARLAPENERIASALGVARKQLQLETTPF